MSQPTSYTRTAVLLHWLMALLLVVTFAIGVYSTTLTGPARLGQIFNHKALATVFMVLLLLRLVWRFINKPPAYPDSMPPMMRTAAHAGHWLLYVLMIIVPLNGWLASSAFGYPVMLAGVIQLPMLLAKDPELGKTLIGLHQPLAYLLAAVISAHVIAAMWHHYAAKDGITKRMSLRSAL